LRNLGGIIIIDFIDMAVQEHRRQVLRALEKALDRDNVRTQVNEVSSLGLVEMTRKRTRESLGQVLCDECTVCDGRGMQKTVETVGFEVAREIIRQSVCRQSSSIHVNTMMLFCSNSAGELLEA